MARLKGVVDSYFETGCEGLVWSFEEDGKTDWDALHFIGEGDYLTILNEDGTIAFDGEIDPDYEIGWAEYPLNPGNGQPCALGYWIHWTQKGWQPDDWAKLFIRGQPKLRALLIKAKKHVSLKR